MTRKCSRRCKNDLEDAKNDPSTSGNEQTTRRGDSIHSTASQAYNSQDILYSLAGGVGSRAGDGDDQ